MQNEYRVATGYLKLLTNDPDLAKVLKNSFGSDTQALFAKEYLSSTEVEPVFKAFADAGLESWVLRFGNRLDSTTHAALGFAVLSAPDLRTALEVFANYACVRTTASDVKLEEVQQRLRISAKDNTGSELVGRWMIEAGISVAKRLIENVMAHPLGSNAKIEFAFSRPNYAAELDTYFGVKCEYQAQQNALSIPASWGRVSSPLSNPDAFRSNLAQCEVIKQRLMPNLTALDFVRSELNIFFENTITGHVDPSELPSQIALAEKYALSPRTFARKLDRLGTSYKKELATARQKEAADLLNHTHLRIAEIAYYLGYQETANFIRAFKSWYGITPSSWRRNPNRNNRKLKDNND